MQEQDKEQPKQESYFEHRIYNQIGLKPDDNFIIINNPEAEFPAATSYKIPLVYPDKDDNIVIPVYTLDAYLIPVIKQGDGKMAHINAKIKSFEIVRLKNPIITKDGDVMKYVLPKGAGTKPWLSPNILEAFKTKQTIDTLILTEGYLKALSGYVNSLYMVGFSSITHYKDSTTKEMYSDVIKVIKQCRVKNVIMLYDADLLDISTKDLQEKRNLTRRPNQFFNSIAQIHVLLKDYIGETMSLYFAHVAKGTHPTEPKGLDDLFEAVEDKKAVADDILSFSKKNFYFYKECIDFGVLKLQRYFNLNSVESFYEKHVEKIGKTEFVYKGSHYKANDKGIPELILKAEVKDYFRVVDDYYWKRPLPNRYNELVTRITKISKKTIEEDHGKKFCTHIAKYNGFVNIPDNINYTESPFNCYNIYQEIKYKPAEVDKDCPAILKFLQHIFQEHFELGLDYLQLLYTKPKQMLPILCLVSKENETGKSTFVNFLQEIWGDNSIDISSQDFESPFNEHYATKFLIICQETLLEKDLAMNKLKNLGTAESVVINGKNTKPYTIDFYGKIILASNFEEKMLNIGPEDKRYWILKVPAIPESEKNPDLKRELREEIPAFLNFLINRKLTTDGKNSRMWFKLSEIDTGARQKMIASSGSALKKILQRKFAEYAERWDLKEFYMNIKSIRECFKISDRYEDYYIEKVLQEDFQLEIILDEKGKPKPIRFKYFTEESTYNPTDNVREIKQTIHRLQARRVYYIPADKFTDAEIAGKENLLEEPLNEHGLPLKENLFLNHETTKPNNTNDDEINKLF